MHRGTAIRGRLSLWPEIGQQNRDWHTDLAHRSLNPDIGLSVVQRFDALAYLNPDVLIDSMICRWKTKKTVTVGNAAITEAARM